MAVAGDFPVAVEAAPALQISNMVRHRSERNAPSAEPELFELIYVVQHRIRPKACDVLSPALLDQWAQERLEPDQMARSTWPQMKSTSEHARGSLPARVD